MIRVYRGAAPDGFTTRCTNWEKGFQKAVQQNTKLTASKYWSNVRRKIRADAQALYVAFNGKCAFCESKMAHTSSPHIEHYRPKSKYPDLMFAWHNWLLSCGRCNGQKWAHFPYCGNEPCLVEPTTEEPEEHIDFFAAQIFPKTYRGEKTIKLIGLDRSPLEEERARWLMSINTLLLLALIPDTYDEARELLIWAMQADAPYAAMSRCYLNEKVPRLANPEIPHPFVKSSNQIERIATLVEQYTEQLQALF